MVISQKSRRIIILTLTEDPERFFSNTSMVVPLSNTRPTWNLKKKNITKNNVVFIENPTNIKPSWNRSIALQSCYAFERLFSFDCAEKCTYNPMRMS